MFISSSEKHKNLDVNPKMITLARESRGMTRKELAKRLTVSPAKLFKLETGLCSTQEEELGKLSNILDYPKEFFAQWRSIYCRSGLYYKDYL